VEETGEDLEIELSIVGIDRSKLITGMVTIVG
jgi:hypothetical protein